MYIRVTYDMKNIFSIRLIWKRLLTVLARRYMPLFIFFTHFIKTFSLFSSSIFLVIKIGLYAAGINV